MPTFGPSLTAFSKTDVTMNANDLEVTGVNQPGDLLTYKFKNIEEIKGENESKV